MAKTPLALVKERFGDKAKLVEAVQALATQELWLDKVNVAKGLGLISNAKLLRIVAALEDAKKRFGSRQNLIAAIAKVEKREKDAGYQARLAAYPLPRLLDLHDAAVKRAARAAKKPAAPAKKKVARSKKAQAKAQAS